MGGNNEFFENFERNKYLKKLPSMQRVKELTLEDLLCRIRVYSECQAMKTFIMSLMGKNWLRVVIMVGIFLIIIHDRRG